MTRRIHHGLLLGTSLIALAAWSQGASAQNLVNPSGSTVGTGFIKVDTGDVFDNVYNRGIIFGDGSAGPGIEIEGSGTVLGDVRNVGGGFIGVYGGETGTGIRVDGSGASVGDDVDNFGLIQIETTKLGYGIRVDGTDQFVGGDVANRGEGVMNVFVSNVRTAQAAVIAIATADGVSAYGISVAGDVTGIDDVANFGVMNVVAAATGYAAVSGVGFGSAKANITGPVYAVGVDVSATSIGGAVINAGALDVAAAAHAVATIHVTGGGATAAVGDGDVVAEARAIGVHADIGDIGGGVANVGSIDVSAEAHTIDHAYAHASTAGAVARMLQATLTRSAAANATGLWIEGPTGTVDGVLNTGAIDAHAFGLVEVHLTAAADLGVADAYIATTNGASFLASANAYGIYVSQVDTIERGVLLAGDVSAAATGVVEVSLGATGDAAFAYIHNKSDLLKFAATASGTGVFVGAKLVDGDFVNNGDIHFDANAVLLVGVDAHGGGGTAEAYISAQTSDLTFAATADSALGLYLDIGTVEGDLVNRGAIDLAASANVRVHLSAESDGPAEARIQSGGTLSFAASVVAYGYYADVDTVGGDFVNAGDILADGHAVVDVGIAATGETATARIESNSGYVDFSATAQVTGLYAGITYLDGDFRNSGDVTALAQAAVDVALSAHGDAGGANAHVTGYYTLYFNAQASATGLYPSITTVNGDVVNSGAVTADASAAVHVALHAESDDGVVGAKAYITNYYDVSFTASANAYGYYASISTIGGSYENSGDVDAVAHAAIDAHLTAHAVGGPAQAFIDSTDDYLQVTASAYASGMYQSLGSVGGDVINSGDVDVTAHATAAMGVKAEADDGAAEAYMESYYSLQIYASASLYGIEASIGSIGGNYENSGDVNGVALASVDVAVTAIAGDGDADAFISSSSYVTISDSAFATGLYTSITTVGGDFLNSGAIDIGAEADVTVKLAAVARTGGDAAAYINSYRTLYIEASASATGIHSDISTVVGDYDNSGALSAVAIADVDVALSATAYAGAAAASIVNNDGYQIFITATAQATGLYASIGSVGGDVRNSGDVIAAATAELGLSLSAYAAGGDAAARIDALDHVTISASATANGVYFNVGTVGGDVVNSGDVTSVGVAHVTATLAATADFDNAAAYIAGRGTDGYVAVSARADVEGVYLNLGNVSGAVRNSGDITAAAYADAKLKLTADSPFGTAEAYLAGKSHVTFSAAATASGLAMSVATVGEDVVNSGDIHVEAVAAATATLSADAGISGNAYAYIHATNGPIHLTAHAHATGFEFSGLTVDGSVRNSGDIDVVAQSTFDATIKADVSTGSAQAYIEATDHLSISAFASAEGLELSIGNLMGGLTNSGDIDVRGVAELDVALTAHADDASGLAYIASTRDSLQIGASAAAHGVSASFSSVGGNILNTGDLSAAAGAGAVLSLSAEAEGAHAAAYLVANTSLTVSASAHATGLSIGLNTVGGSLTNQGAVHAQASATVDLTLKADAWGGSASAFIESQASDVELSAQARAHGVVFSASAGGGPITNSGDIDATAVAALDVALTATGRTSADVFARIDAQRTVAISATAAATALTVNSGALGGALSNSGALDVAAGAGLKLSISADATDGDAFAYIVADVSDLSISASANAIGFNIAMGTAGNVSNSGNVTADATARVDLDIAATARNAGHNGDAYIAATGSDGTVVISASASAYGLHASYGSGGQFTNSGDLDVAALAVLDVALSADVGTGNAHAYIFASASLTLQARALAQGLSLTATQTDGFANTGDVTSDALATLAIDISADPIGDASAYLSSFSNLGVSARATAQGLAVGVDSMGAASNAGALDVTAGAKVDLTLAASGVDGDAKAFVFASDYLTITAQATAYGFAITGTGPGSVENTGAISAAAAAELNIDIGVHGDDAAGAISAFINSTGRSVLLQASANADGVVLSAGNVSGSVVNSGDLDVTARADLDLDLHATAENGAATAYIYANDTVAILASAQAFGVNATAGIFGGTLSNSGDITAMAMADLDVALTAAGEAGAKATIHASEEVRIAASALARGINSSGGTLGGFSNSGDIIASAVAHLRVGLSADSSGPTTAFIDGSAGTFIDATANAFGIYLQFSTIGGDVTNSGDVLAVATARATVSGLDTAVAYTAKAFAAAMFVGSSGTVSGDVGNSGVLSAVAGAGVGGTGTRLAIATAVGLDVQMNVNGDVVNAGTIVALAGATTANAFGIRVVGHAVSGSIQNTGVIAAFAEGTTTEANALDVTLATGATRFEQLNGLIIGDLDLVNAFADDVEFSGGIIVGDLRGAGGDELLAYRGAGRQLNFFGDIDGLAAINVNTFGASASSLAPVELWLHGDVTNTAALNVNTHGTLVVGLQSQLNVTTYTQVSTGTTLFEVAPGGESGVIVPGTANLAGTVGIRTTGALYGDSESYLVIDGGTINGTYERVRSTALLHVDDRYVGNDVYLDVTRVAFGDVGGLTNNQHSVGDALEADYDDLVPGSDFADVVGLLFGLSADQYQNALDDLAGAEHAQMLKIGAGAIQSIDNALMGRLAFVRGLNAQQMASVDGVGMAFAQVASTGDVDLRMDLAQAEAQQMAAPGQSGVWARVFGGRTSLDGDEEAPGYDTTGGGVSIGVDHRISPDLVVGLYGGYAHTDADFDQSGADGSVDTYQVGVYGSWAQGGLHIDGLLAGAWQNYDVSRTIDFLGRRANSDYDGWGVSASARVGYDVMLGSAAVLEPMVGLDYVHLETDGFEESGADSVDLNVDSGAYDSLKSTLGVRLTAQLDMGDGMTLVPTASVGWEHEFLDANGEVTASFAGSPNGTNFDIVGSDDEADAAVISLGVALTSDNMTAFVGYDGRMTGDASAHQGTVGVRFGF